MPDVGLLVDARPVSHPTAGGRGIGNYTLGLLQGLASVGANFTALVEHAADASRLAGVSPSSIEVLHRDVFRRAAPSSWFIATGLFLHPIPFDPIPATVTEAGIPVAAVMYDVIPFRRPDLYLGDENAARQARLRASLARTVDVHLAISAFSARTAIEELGLNSRRMRVIGAGVDARFVPPAVHVTPRPKTVVAVTGGDPRKNTDGLLRAWSQVDASVRAEHRLIVVAGVGRAHAERWRELAVSLGCAGSIEVARELSDGEVVRLLQDASLVVQPSLEEGFGLPVAEAAACGRPVISSNTSALPEVLDEPSATFDPGDTGDMARAIERALTDADHRMVLIAAAQRAARRWRWPVVAQALLTSIDELGVADRRRPLATRLAVVERPGATGSLTVEQIRHVVDGAVTSLVDRTTSVAPAARSLTDVEWPAAGFGRYVKYHDFDHVMTVLDADGDDAIVNRLARRWPTHVWARRRSVDAAVATSSRSVIVSTLDLAERLDRSADARLPVLVLPEPHRAWTGDDVARSLVWWLEVGHRADRAVTVTGPASTLS